MRALLFLTAGVLCGYYFTDLFIGPSEGPEGPVNQERVRRLEAQLNQTSSSGYVLEEADQSVPIEDTLSDIIEEAGSDYNKLRERYPDLGFVVANRYGVESFAEAASVGGDFLRAWVSGMQSRGDHQALRELMIGNMDLFTSLYGDSFSGVYQQTVFPVTKEDLMIQVSKDHRGPLQRMMLEGKSAQMKDSFISGIEDDTERTQTLAWFIRNLKADGVSEYTGYLLETTPPDQRDMRVDEVLSQVALHHNLEAAATLMEQYPEAGSPELVTNLLSSYASDLQPATLNNLLSRVSDSQSRNDIIVDYTLSRGPSLSVEEMTGVLGQMEGSVGDEAARYYFSSLESPEDQAAFFDFVNSSGQFSLELREDMRGSLGG